MNGIETMTMALRKLFEINKDEINTGFLTVFSCRVKCELKLVL
jgi:hypothetical protein